jgi:ribosomal protein L33
MYIGNRPKNNNWVMKGIKFSSTRKRQLYILYKNTNSIQIKHYYKKYCKILKKVITEVKTIHFNN